MTRSIKILTEGSEIFVEKNSGCATITVIDEGQNYSYSHSLIDGIKIIVNPHLQEKENIPKEKEKIMSNTNNHPLGLLSKISDQVKVSKGKVCQRLVDQRVEAELDKRATLLDKALTLHTAATKEQRKLDKPDVRMHDTDGKVVSEGFSPQLTKKRTEAKAKVAKIEKAISAALDDGDWGQLGNLKGSSQETKD